MSTRISQSRAKSWRRCHKAHDYKHNQHLRVKAPPRPMYIGSIVHDLTDTYAKGGSWEKKLKEHERKIKPFVREDPEAYEDVIPLTTTIFTNYLRKYEDDGLTFVESELELTYDMGDDVELILHIDKVVEDDKDRLWIMDHKCHRNIPDEKNRMSDMQLVIYPVVWNKLYPERKATGIIWDYMRTKVPTVPEVLKNGQLSKRKNIDTTHEVYLDEILKHNLNPDDYRDMLDMLRDQQDGFYERVFLPVANDTMVKTIMDDMKSTGIEIKELGEVLTDRNLGFDCNRCMFYDLCMAELRGLDSSYIRKSRYTVEEYNGEEAVIDD